MALRRWLVRFAALYFSFTFTYAVAYGLDPIAGDFHRSVRYVLYMLIPTTIIYVFVAVPSYGLIDRYTNWFHNSPRLHDLFFALVFLVVATLFMFWPQDTGFSFGDSGGEIISHGVVTPYGYHTKVVGLAWCLVSAVTYVVICFFASTFFGYRWNSMPRAK